MDKNVTVRFYEVRRNNNNVPLLKDVLDGIAGIEVLENREGDAGGGFMVRLERLEPDGPNAVVGEFTRIQTTNWPSEVLPDGTRPLDIDGPLGHGVAFRFDHARSILAFQYDFRVMAPGRLLNYLKAVWDDTSYRLVPMVSEDMWERFDRGPTRKVMISVASPATLPEIEDAGGAVADTFRTLGGAFEAPVIKLEMSMGQRKGALGGDIREAVLGLFGKHSDGEIDLRGLKAVAETNEGDPNDEIDLMNELLCERAELELPDNNPEVSYQIRKNFLRMAMRNNVR